MWLLASPQFSSTAANGTLNCLKLSSYPYTGLPDLLMMKFLEPIYSLRYQQLQKRLEYKILRAQDHHGLRLTHRSRSWSQLWSDHYCQQHSPQLAPTSIGPPHQQWLYLRQLQAGFDPDRGTEFGPCRFARELGGLHPLCPPNLKNLSSPLHDFPPLQNRRQLAGTIQPSLAMTPRELLPFRRKASKRSASSAICYYEPSLSWNQKPS